MTPDDQLGNPYDPPKSSVGDAAVAGPGERAEPKSRWIEVSRDVLMIFLLTGLGGLVIGIATGGPSASPQRYVIALAASNILFGAVGFAISGCLAPRARWRHLGKVAVWVWLLSLLNIAFFGTTVAQWLASSIFVAATMGLGGLISFAFKKGSRRA